MLSIRTILHPTDFSKQSEFAWQFASSLARDYRARLILLHVQPIPVAAYGEFGALPPGETPGLEFLRDKLAKVEPTVPGVKVERFVTEGDAASHILALAKDQAVDVIVMGTHGRSGFGRLLMGSVAEEVSRRASCPVLTVKGPMPSAAPLAPAPAAATV